MKAKILSLIAHTYIVVTFIYSVILSVKYNALSDSYDYAISEYAKSQTPIAVLTCRGMDGQIEINAPFGSKLHRKSSVLYQFLIEEVCYDN